MNGGGEGIIFTWQLGNKGRGVRRKEKRRRRFHFWLWPKAADANATGGAGEQLPSSFMTTYHAITLTVVAIPCLYQNEEWLFNIIAFFLANPTLWPQLPSLLYFSFRPSPAPPPPPPLPLWPPNNWKCLSVTAPPAVTHQGGKRKPRTTHYGISSPHHSPSSTLPFSGRLKPRDPSAKHQTMENLLLLKADSPSVLHFYKQCLSKRGFFSRTRQKQHL